MAGVKPSKFINYISQFKKLFVTRNNGVISQKFKIDSNITDDYYFQIVNSNNQIVNLSGKNFAIYGSIQDAKGNTHVLFYTDRAELNQAQTQFHFKIDTYTSQYLKYITFDRQIDITIVETYDIEKQVQTEDQNNLPTVETITQNITQVVLRDVGLAYKRAYIDGKQVKDIFYRDILTGTVPWVGQFGAGQDITLTLGSNGAAFGTGLEQTGNNQLVIGQFNETDNTKAFVIGNGTDPTNRSNSLTIDYNGNIEANSISAASLYIGGVQIGSDLNEKFEATSAWALDTFALKDDIPVLSAGVGINVNVVDGVTWITNTGGSSGTGDKTYLNGTGLGLSTVSAEDAIYKFYVNTEWLSTTIDAQVSGQFDDLSIQVSANEEKIETISGTFNDYTKTVDLADYISANVITGYATTEWVEEQEYATTGVVDTASTTIIDSLTAYALSTNVYSKAEVDDVVTSAVNDLATGAVATNTIDIGLVDGRVQAIEADYTTSAQVSSIVTGYNYITSAEIPTSYVQQDTLTAYATKEALDELSGVTSGLPNRVEALETVSSSFALAENVYSKSVADETFATKGEIPTVSDLSAGMYEAISGDVETQITGKNYITSDALTGLASDEDLQYVSGVVSAQAADITALKAVSGQVDYTTVYDMLSSGNTNTLTITKDDEAEKIVFTATGGGSGDKTYTGASGIIVDNINDVIGISATIPSVDGLASEQWVETNFLSTSYGTTITTNSEDIAAIKALTGDFALTSDVVDQITYTVDDSYISNLGFVTDSDVDEKITSTVDDTYISDLGFTTQEETAILCGALSAAITGVVDDLSTNYLTKIDADQYYAAKNIEDEVTANTTDLTALKAISGDFASTSSSFALTSDVYTKTIADQTFATKGEISDFVDSEGVSSIVEGYNYISSITLSAYNASTMQNEAVQTTAIDLASSDFVTWNGKIYINDTKFDIPTDSDISGIASAVASTYVDGYATEQYVQTASSLITGWVEEQGYGTGSAISAVGQLINDVGYITQSIVEGYNYATQTELQTTSSTITAQIPDDAHISAIASGYAGGGSSISSVYEMLNAGENINLTKNDSTGVTTIDSPINNQQNKLTLTGAVVEYSSQYEIFETTGNPVVDGAITIQPIANTNSIEYGKVAEFEYWVTPSATITGFNFDSSYTVLGQMPQTFSDNSIQVFKVKVYNSSTGIKQYISYEYSFDNPWFTPLTFKGIAATNGVALTSSGTPDAITLNYSKNGGAWTSYTVGDIIDLASGDTVAFSGANNTFGKSDSSYYKFVMTGTIEAEGNIQSLLNYSLSCTSYCYSYMFNGCNSLISVPSLPAITIADRCYRDMFYNCKNLSSVPQNLLPATTMYNYCYYNMFRGCSSLTSAPQLPATTLAPDCYNQMFRDCTSLTAAPQLPAATLYSSCYSVMFFGCKNLLSAKIDATNVNNSYNNYCMGYMFQTCSKLSSIEVNFTSWPNAYGATSDWLNGVASNGTFICPTALGTNETITRGNNNCPTNWTVVNK